MTSWSLADRKHGDEILIQPWSGGTEKLDIMISDTTTEADATIILDKDEAIALRDALTRFIEAMP